MLAIVAAEVREVLVQQSKLLEYLELDEKGLSLKFFVHVVFSLLVVSCLTIVGHHSDDRRDYGKDGYGEGKFVHLFLLNFVYSIIITK